MNTAPRYLRLRALLLAFALVGTLLPVAYAHADISQTPCYMWPSFGADRIAACYAPGDRAAAEALLPVAPIAPDAAIAAVTTGVPLPLVQLQLDQYTSILRPVTQTVPVVTIHYLFEEDAPDAARFGTMQPCTRPDGPLYVRVDEHVGQLSSLDGLSVSQFSIGHDAAGRDTYCPDWIAEANVPEHNLRLYLSSNVGQAAVQAIAQGILATASGATPLPLTLTTATPSGATLLPTLTTVATLTPIPTLPAMSTPPGGTTGPCSTTSPFTAPTTLTPTALATLTPTALATDTVPPSTPDTTVTTTFSLSGTATAAVTPIPTATITAPTATMAPETTTPTSSLPAPTPIEMAACEVGVTGTATIPAPPPLSVHVVSPDWSTGGALVVHVRTLPHAWVGLTLRLWPGRAPHLVSLSRTTPVRHVPAVTALTRRGVADARGLFALRLSMPPSIVSPLQATLTVMARVGGRSTAQTLHLALPVSARPAHRRAAR